MRLTYRPPPEPGPGLVAIYAGEAPQLKAPLEVTAGKAWRLEELPDLFDRIKEPIVWQVPEGGVRYLQFHHGPPEAGSKFVGVDVELRARMKIGYPVLPKCFRLVDDEGTRYKLGEAWLPLNKRDAVLTVKLAGG